MKKIVSLVVFVAALVWTWNVIHTNEAIGFETHAGIQTKLAELIKATLSAKKPNAKDLRIDKLWTESMTDNKVRAVFAYKFSEAGEAGENLEQIIEGEAILHREPTEDKTDKWTLQSVKTTNDIVVFSEGSTVTPDTPSEAPATTPAATPAPTEHDQH
ncbi:hypothetical protein B9G69_016330 [Bdellovibrio sp. SKB1291214]|uniref:hypothetical protein n=1 Tax=Bdellovibrio sp. SKB1291214 TaxID=1732569 RepID=UPI000B6DBC0E|nr:hypothetical protein [Bdellovibrio sp. SKB1291214]UYL08611.1 hypothetical protein B9G69_016330 [Bdellovibrio sp. SKB1291214]